MKIIGLDVGEKRIGVAKADSNTRIAIPVKFVNVDGTEWQEIDKIAKLNNTNLFVLGLPRSNEGNETKQSLFVRNFAKELIKKIPGAKVQFQDESLTSVEAERRLKERKKKYEKGEIDAESAAIILQDFIENFKTRTAAKKVAAQPVVENTEKDDTKAKDSSAYKNAAKKRKIWGIIAIAVLILGLGGTTAALKCRDYIREQREIENARKEAEMKPAVFRFTITPGETIFDIKKKLLAIDRNGDSNREDKIPNYTVEEIEAAFNADYDFDFLKERPEGASLEGYLYGDTYEFYGEDTVEDILGRFLARMGEEIQENDLKNKYQEQGLTLHEGITLASIVQKEAPSPEQPTVAQVFLTRLAYGWRLGSDVTVSYGLDVLDPERNIYTDNQAALMVDSCYNTRLYAGLPCGPISNPGESALLSVAYPSDTSYLYFLTGDDGLMYYSYTEAEHNQNIYLHCQDLCNVSL